MGDAPIKVKPYARSPQFSYVRCFVRGQRGCPPGEQCQWYGIEPTPGKAGDLGRLHLRLAHA